MNLVRDIRLGFSYRFSSEEPAATRGTIGLDAEIANASGWSRTIELAAPRPFDGGQAGIAGTLDVGRVRSLAAEAASATGESGAVTVTLRPDVTVVADVAGQSIDEGFRPTLDYQLTDTQLRAPEATDDDDPFTTHRSDELAVPGRQAATLEWAGRAIDVPTARWLSVGVAAACIAALVGLAVASRRTARLSETDRLRRRWRGLIVDGEADDMLRSRIVRLADMSALVALAQSSGRPIVHDRLERAFLLDLDQTLYRYEPAAGAQRPARGEPAAAAPSAPGVPAGQADNVPAAP